MAISSEISATGAGSQRSGGHRGMAFLVEALVVLAFLMISLAVFVKLFAGSQIEARNAGRMSTAVQLATNCAEEFSADPQHVQATTEREGLTATCEVRPTRHRAGTLYEATIVVRDGEQELYTLATSRYVSGNSGGDVA